jgi:hypothetical protein
MDAGRPRRWSLWLLVVVSSQSLILQAVGCWIRQHWAPLLESSRDSSGSAVLLLLLKKHTLTRRLHWQRNRATWLFLLTAQLHQKRGM